MPQDIDVIFTVSQSLEDRSATVRVCTLAVLPLMAIGWIEALFCMKRLRHVPFEPISLIGGFCLRSQRSVPVSRCPTFYLLINNHTPSSLLVSST